MSVLARAIGAIGAIGATIIYALIWLFGRTCRWADVPWLAGPLGGTTIGDAPYREVAEREGLALERRARDGGLVPDFAALAGDGFARAHAALQDGARRVI